MPLNTLWYLLNFVMDCTEVDLQEFTHMNYLHVGTMSSSKSRVHRDHSIWTAVIGCTACARLISDAEVSDKPKCLTFPSSTNFFISPTWKNGQNSQQTNFLIYENRLQSCASSLCIESHKSKDPRFLKASCGLRGGQGCKLTVISMGTLRSTRCR